MLSVHNFLDESWYLRVNTLMTPEVKIRLRIHTILVSGQCARDQTARPPVGGYSGGTTRAQPLVVKLIQFLFTKGTYVIISLSATQGSHARGKRYENCHHVHWRIAALFMVRFTEEIPKQMAIECVSIHRGAMVLFKRLVNSMTLSNLPRAKCARRTVKILA